MNAIIRQLPLIAEAAEYHDRATGAAWKLKNAVTNPLIWACARYLRLQATTRPDDSDPDAPEIDPQNPLQGALPELTEPIQHQIVTVATLRTWYREFNNCVLETAIDFPMIQRTLGLTRNLDPHTEACRQARQRCLAARSAARFQEFYNTARTRLHEQIVQREEQVALIYDLCLEQGFVLSGEFNGFRETPQFFHDEFVPDNQLADDDALSEQSERLAETVATIIEALDQANDEALARTVTQAKLERLLGYETILKEMYTRLGIDRTRVTQVRASLNASLDKQIAALEAKHSQSARRDEQLKADLATLEAALAPPPPSKGHRGPRVLVKSPEHLARDAAEAAARIDLPPEPRPAPSEGADA